MLSNDSTRQHIKVYTRVLGSTSLQTAPCRSVQCFLYSLYNLTQSVELRGENFIFIWIMASVSVLQIQRETRLEVIPLNYTSSLGI